MAAQKGVLALSTPLAACTSQKSPLRLPDANLQYAKLQSSCCSLRGTDIELKNAPRSLPRYKSGRIVASVSSPTVKEVEESQKELASREALLGIGGCDMSPIQLQSSSTQLGGRVSGHGKVSSRADSIEFSPRRAQPGESSTAKPEMGLSDSSLESTAEHRLWLGFGTSATVAMIAKAVVAAHSSADVAGIGMGAIAAYVLADLGTGVYHWGIDNYGDAKTPVFGSQIDAFQGHHRRPWTITKREFSNNIHAIARPVGFVLLPFLLLPSNSAGDTFLGLFLGLIILSQQFHAWAHSKKSQLPAVVNFLQERGILISRRMHGIHHKAPYSINYCIVSGIWNPLLNDSKFFPRLEEAIFSRWAVAPRNWVETAPEWSQDGSYFEDGTEIKLDQE